MKNKKGFVFVETIVVCSVVAVSLITIYTSFALLLNSQKKRSRYNQAMYNYRMYYFAKAIKANGNSLDSCATSSNPGLSSGLANIKPDKLYYVSTSNLSSLSNDNYLADYIKTIDETDGCLLIGEFKKDSSNSDSSKDEYYYSYVKIEGASN